MEPDVEPKEFKENSGSEKAEIPNPKPDKPMKLDEGPLALPRALSLAIEHNPELKTYSWDIRATESLTVQAQLRPNPELAVTMEEFGGSGARRGFEGAETTVAVTQPIETGGKRDRRTQLAAVETKLAKWDYETARLRIIQETTQAFTEVLGIQEKIKVKQEQMNLAAELLNTVEQRVKAGKDASSKAVKAEIEFAQAQMEYQQAIGALSDAKHRLALCWGETEPGFETVEGAMQGPADLPPLSQLQQQAQKHPQVLRWQDELALRRANVDLIKAHSHADIAVTAGLKRFEADSDNAAVVGLVIPLPLFDRKQGAIEAAQHALAKTNQKRIQTVARFESQLAQSYQRYKTATAYISTLKNNVMTNAETAFETARKGYEEGEFDYLHVLDAQRTLFSHQVRLVEVQLSISLERANLDFFTGRHATTMAAEDSDKRIQ